MASTIVTLALDAENQQRFNALRASHYPSHLNQIAAHLTLFHSLPNAEDIRDALASAARSSTPFTMQVSGLMSLGRGVAYRVQSVELVRLHAALSTAFSPYLSAQDRQGFRPHIVVQDKASGADAKVLHAMLTAGFRPWTVRAEGLQWWDYLGGPWSPHEVFRFGDASAAAVTAPG